MMLSPRDISNQRYKMTGRLRLIVLVLFIIVLVQIMAMLLLEVVDELQYADGIDYLSIEYISWSVAFLLPSVCLWVFEKRVVRWLAPLPKNECLQCGYLLNDLKTDRCPECGYRFADQPTDSHAAV